MLFKVRVPDARTVVNRYSGNHRSIRFSRYMYIGFLNPTATTTSHQLNKHSGWFLEQILSGII